MTCYEYFLNEFDKLAGAMPLFRDKLEIFHKYVFHSGFENYKRDPLSSIFRNMIDTGMQFAAEEIIKEVINKNKEN